MCTLLLLQHLMCTLLDGIQKCAHNAWSTRSVSEGLGNWRQVVELCNGHWCIDVVFRKFPHYTALASVVWQLSQQRCQPVHVHNMWSFAHPRANTVVSTARRTNALQGFWGVSKQADECLAIGPVKILTNFKRNNQERVNLAHYYPGRCSQCHELAKHVRAPDFPVDFDEGVDDVDFVGQLDPRGVVLAFPEELGCGLTQSREVSDSVDVVVARLDHEINGAHAGLVQQYRALRGASVVERQVVFHVLWTLLCQPLDQLFANNRRNAAHHHSPGERTGLPCVNCDKCVHGVQIS
jgi:hypothetical protein